MLRALIERMPGEDYLYLGDTARLPYGAKTPESVMRYSLQCAQALTARGIKALVVACNTASGVALGALATAHAPMPVIGVLEPGAAAAVAATRTGRIAVLATEGTVRGGAYARSISRLLPGARLRSIACPLFVALAEEGLAEGPIARAVADHYLAPLATGEVDTVLLGCTHFPVLLPTLREALGADVALVDSAATTARAVERALAADGLAGAGAARGSARFLATEGAERFARVGARFYGDGLSPADVELVDLAAPAA